MLRRSKKYYCKLQWMSSSVGLRGHSYCGHGLQHLAPLVWGRTGNTFLTLLKILYILFIFLKYFFNKNKFYWDINMSGKQK